MAQTPTRAQKTLLRIGIVRGNLAFLAQPEPQRMSTILNRFALQYRITPNAMTRARTLQGSTAEDCAHALISNLDRLTADASFIQGIGRVDSSQVNPHLSAVAQECETFSLEQPVGTPSSADVAAALGRFLARGLGSGSVAGSALGPEMGVLSMQYSEA